MHITKFGVLVLLAVGVGEARAAPPAPPIEIAACGAVLDVPGATYVLTQDLGCGGTAITFAADDVTLLLNGHDVEGPGASAGSYSGVRVYNATGAHVVGPGSVNRFAFGVLDGANASGSSSGAVYEGFSLAANGIGVMVDRSDVEIADLTVNESGSHGILLTCPSGCSVRDSDLTDNGGSGVFLFTTSESVVSGNVSGGNAFAGILLASVSSDNTISGNVTLANASYGIDVLSGSVGNQIRSNVAASNGVLDLQDENLPTCANLWRNNRFDTDNESGAGAGPKAGCIR